MSNKKEFWTLSILFLIHFFAIGLYLPILSLYLSDILNFNGRQTGLVMSLVLISSLLSPFIGSLTIDKVITKKWMIIICSLFSSLFLFALAYFKTFIAFMLCYVLFTVFMFPVLGVLNAIALERIDEKGKFGIIRLFGTAGWIVASLFFGFFWIEKYGYESLSHSFIIAGISFLCLAIVSLTLKDTKLRQMPYEKNKINIKSIFPHEAIKSLLSPKLRMVLALYFLSYFIVSINTFGVSPFLKQVGFEPSSIMPVQTLGQGMEVISLFMLNYLLVKFGTKSIFRISLICQVCALFLFGYLSDAKQFIYFGLILQGVQIGLLVPSITIYVDSYCDSDNRGAVHQLLSIITGLSLFVGSNISGWIMDFTTQDTRVDFSIFWTVPLIVTVIFWLITELFFRNSPGSTSTYNSSESLTEAGSEPRSESSQ